jgi:NADH-quinone oxidoreductase subunit N
MPISHIVPQMIVVIGAAVVILASLFLEHRRQWVGAPLAVVTLVAASLVQLSLLGRTSQITFQGLWALDGLAGWTSIIIFASTAVAAMLSPEWMRTDHRHGEYYALLLFGAVGASAMAAATDLNELVVGLLIVTVAGYVLASYHRGSPASVEAGMKYFLIGGLTNSLLLIGVVLLYGIGGTTLYAPLSEALGTVDPLALVAVVSLVALGLAFEVGAVPAHAWLPDVAEGSPAPAAAFLTVVPKLGALAALARVMAIIPAEAVGWRPLIAVLAAVTMTIGNLSALWQDDVRRLLGWSSVAQAGYALMAIVAIGRSDLAVPALLFFLLGYAAANLAAFGVVVELRGRTAMADYAGLSSRRPWLAAGMVVALLSLVGIPPLAGFVGKLQLFVATIDAGYSWLALLAVVNTVVSLFYYLRVAAVMYFDTAPRPVPVLGSSAAVGVTVAVVTTAVAGILSGPVLARFMQAQMLP